MDFIVWIMVTLQEYGFLRSIYGRFLLRLLSYEKPVYLHADVEILEGRSGMPREFILRELAVYNVLAKHLSLCSIDTGKLSPAGVVVGVLRCLWRCR